MASIAPIMLPVQIGTLFKHFSSDPSTPYEDKNGVTQQAASGEFPIEYLNGVYQGIKLFVPEANTGMSQVFQMILKAEYLNPKAGHIVFRYKGRAGSWSPRLDMTSGALIVDEVDGWKTYVIEWKNKELADFDLGTGYSQSFRTAYLMSEKGLPPKYLAGIYLSVTDAQLDPDLQEMQAFNRLVNYGALNNV